MIQQKQISDKQVVIEAGRRVVDLEARALLGLSFSIGDSFAEAVEIILRTKGRVVVTGMGKSGHIAGKIAATLASTGTPSFFVHPAELAHGDFGMLTEEDTVIAISNSGETNEVTSILVPIKRRGINLIGITSNNSSTLAEYSDLTLLLGVSEEACPLNLAPTVSTTATLALGDALAVALMEEKKFTKEDFAKFHPGGNLGKQLIKVIDVMRQGKELIPLVQAEDNYPKVLDEISSKKLGFTCVTDESGRLIGLITDGDLRRAQLKFGPNTYQKTAAEIMNVNPQVISKAALASEALRVMEEKRISSLIILSDENKPLGVLDLKDLLKVGIC